MQANAAELIWRGRTHIGDDPGVYGDACYSGLTIELPVTLREFGAGTGAVEVTFELTAEGARSFGPPYPGQKIMVFALTQVPHSNPPVWQRTEIGQGILDKDTASVTARIEPGVRYVSVRVEADVTVTPGRYDDFVLTGLWLRSTSYFAEFGSRLTRSRNKHAQVLSPHVIAMPGWVATAGCEDDVPGVGDG